MNTLLLNLLKRACAAVFAGLCFTSVVNAQQVAFPGAEGAGMYTTGGRGTASIPTTVFEVTNLSDDGLPGSLRYAVTTTAAYRTVVFRVSGTIHLNSRLNIKANTTIAGQTAPGDGICVADHPVYINGDNVIVRYMRFRLGDRYQKKTDASGNPINGSGGDDAFGGLGVNNVIIDHVSVGWSNDEALTIYGGDNITVQWSFITEPLNYSYHWETGDTDWEHHGYGGIWGGKRASFHHNLLAHCYSRNPRFAGISSYSPATVGAEKADLRNNVIYNWGINSVYGGEGGYYNVVNNYYKYGPSTSSSVRYRIANPSKTATIPYGQWYINGNYVDGSSTNTNNNWKGVTMQGGAADTSLAKVITPFDLGYPVTTHSAQDAYEYVLQGAGATLPARDTLDQRIVLNVRNRTGRIIDVQGGYPHGTPYAATVNAWPTLNATPAPVDDDHDGMPNAWETSNGLNPMDASDRSLYAANGYTNIENYLNSLTSPAIITSPSIFINGSLNPFVQTIGTPSATQTFQISGINLTNNITVTPPVNYEISADNGTTWFNNANPLVLTQTAGTVNATTITVRLNATANGTYNGSVNATSPGAFTASISVNGSTGAAAQNSDIGAFPSMDGGFERQLAGAVSGVSSHTSTTKWEASSAITMDSLSARTGLKSMHWNTASTSNKYLFSPVLSGNTLQSSTQYVVQFWYRLPAQLTGNIAGTSDLKLYGWSTLVGATGGTGSTSTSAVATLNSTSTVGTWSLFTGVLTTTADAPTNTYMGLKVTYPQSPYFDIDDYVVYPGSAVDNTAPDAVTNALATGNISDNSISVTWSAPAAGIDNGGYMIVRSSSATAPVPNVKGVYVAGNKIGTDSIVYIGSGTSYTDLAVVSGETYYYHIFTVDKAYNYSAVTTLQGVVSSNPPTVSTSGSLTTFAQTLGSPSSVQTYSLSGTDLTSNVIVTPPSGFEVSVNGTNWYNSSTPLTIAPAAGTVAATTISVRLNAGSTGGYSGNITNASTGATTRNVAVNGNVTSISVPPPGTNVIVAWDGSGNFTTIQAAINAAPASSTVPYIIYIKNGKYREKVSIPSNKPFIHLIGESIANTILSWDDYSGKLIPGGGGATYGTSNSATLTINAPDCLLKNLTVENTTGDAPQALAINVNADRFVAVNCRFLGGQDTVLTNGTGRQYFKSSYIDGTVDFIFGSAKVIFDSCVIYPKTRQDGLTGSYITAANTPSGQAYGYVFRDCVIPSNFGTTSYVLGRPWQNDGTSTTPAHNKVVWINTTMGNNIIKPEGWSTWSSGTNTAVIYYGEYRSRKFDSSLVDVSSRVPWSYQLTAAEAQTYNFANIFGTWDPCTVNAGVCNAGAREIAVSNFKAKKGTSTTPSFISWNISWPMSGITYQLFRSSDNISFTQINQQVSVTDTAVNFSYSEAIPPPGSTYYYYLKAFKSGLNTHSTDTLQISSTPTITVTGTLSAFLQGVGTPSANQVYTVSAVNLSSNLMITPPVNYEVSANSGATWFTNSTPLVLTPASGTVASTTITVRLNGSSAGTFNGDILHASTGAVSVNQPVTGTIQSSPLPQPSVVLQQWTLLLNNADSAGVRSPDVTPSTPVFNNLYLSNGTTLPAVPAYSVARGQAFGASANGDGSWGTAAGGPGGNLNRMFYEQFTVTAAAGSSVQVDSILLTSAFYNTSSNTKLAVVYSRSGFVSDSADVTGGTGPAGPLVSTANGGFTTPVLLANQTAGPTNSYAFALNGANGVVLNSGQTLSVRLYFSCGSTSTGRYAMLKNVIAKGVASAMAPTITVTGTLNSFTQTTGVPSAAQNYTLNGAALTGNVTVTPPAGYEVSTDGITWYTAAAPLVISPVAGNVNQVISVRLNSATSGTWSGDIVNASTGAVSKNISVTGITTNAPSITTTGTISGLTQVLGSPSPAQSYTVNGNALVNDITLVAPANFEISADGGATWFNSATPLVLQQTAGSVPVTTIMVRLNATASGTYSGAISHTSNGAASQSVNVSGVTINPAITTTGTLTPFTSVAGTPSAIQTYTVSAADLINGLTITPPANYEVSSNGGASWFTNANPLVLPRGTGGAINSTTISVRLNAAAAGSYTGNITHTSTSAATVNVAVSGTTVALPVITVTGTLSAFAQTIGNPSATKTYTVSGANLVSNLTITPPAGYELSANGGANWSNNTTPLVLTPASGSIATTTITVRLNASAAGTYNGNITHTSSGAAAANVAVTGVAVLPPGLSVTANLQPFTQVLFTPSAIQSYTVTGNNLTGNVTITPPSRYEISVNGGSSWSLAPVTLTPSSGSVNATVLVRLNAPYAGSFNGNIVHATAGSANVNIAVTGTTSVQQLYTAYPNPVNRVLFISHPVIPETATLTLYDYAGHLLSHHTVQANTSETGVNVSHLPHGVYTIRYLRGNELKVMRFIK